MPDAGVFMCLPIHRRPWIRYVKSVPSSACEAVIRFSLEVRVGVIAVLKVARV